VEDCAGELEADYLEKLQSAVAGVEAVLATAGPETETGDVKALQAACSRLDEVSRLLAERLMDRAMEAMLRRRGLIS
jgi:hypothetical protein